MHFKQMTKPRRSNHPIRSLSPAKLIASSFFLIIMTGALLLMLPIASKDGQATGFVDTLFTATSATCITGLVVFDTFSKWTLFGQVIILLLIQVGGLGLVSFTTFFMLTIRHKIGLRDRNLAKESINLDSPVDINRMLKIIIFSTFAIESLGALILMIRFIPLYGNRGVFISVFLSVSAYCNAGFDILGFKGKFSNLVTFNDDPLVVLTIAGLIIIGGLGFIVFQDILYYKKSRKLMLHTKIVLLVTFILLSAGTLIFLLMEINGSMEKITFGQKLLNAFFISVTSRTAGYTTLDLSLLHDYSKALLVFLMFIGGAPGSTAGGIKVTTFAVIAMTVAGVVKGRDDTVVFGRKIDKRTVYKSITIVILAMILVLFTTAVIMIAEKDVSMIDALFESVSAFANVGLSINLTPTLHAVSKLILSLTMYIGRVGPISFAVALSAKSFNHKKIEVLPEAQIMVG